MVLVNIGAIFKMQDPEHAHFLLLRAVLDQSQLTVKDISSSLQEFIT